MKKIIWICIITLLIYITVGCGRAGKMPEGLIKKDIEGQENSGLPLIKSDANSEEAEQSLLVQQNASLYFWDEDNNKLICESRNIVATDITSFVSQVVAALIRGPKSENLQSVIPRGTEVIGVEKTDNILTVDLSEKFLEAEDLLVARTALVNTLTDLEGIEYVKISINDQELTSDGTKEGQPLGVLSKATNNINELIATQDQGSDVDRIKEINRELLFRDFRGRYLLSEVRPITIKGGAIARAIIEELIKGPMASSEGLYPVIPQGTQLLDINLQDIENDEDKIVVLYFSKELKAPFTDEQTSRSANKKEDPAEVQERVEQIKNKETIILSAIVYNLSSLSNIKGVKIFYQDRDGNYIDRPLYSIDLKKPLTTRDFPNKLGRKIKVYFVNESATHLVPDYRAMSRKNMQIANTIIDELILGPKEDTKQLAVFPPEIARGEIKVWMDPNNVRVMVDLPSKLDGSKMGSAGALMTLYAMVNSLTDPVNTQNIKEVQFLVEGKVVKNFGNIVFSEPFIRNPAIIEE